MILLISLIKCPYADRGIMVDEYIDNPFGANKVIVKRKACQLPYQVLFGKNRGNFGRCLLL
jgi:hypothetical protein